MNQADYKLSTEDYKKDISEEKNFYLQFNIFTPAAYGVIYKIIHRFLEHYDILYIKDPVINVIKELVNNAVKANLKRLYFKVNNLDINNTDEYRKGMESFKNDAYQAEDSSFIEKLDNSNFIVRISFKSMPGSINISIINNSPILDVELKKINARIEKAVSYTDISDAFEDVLDDSEGAGLGLIMAVLLLKNSGFPENSLSITKKENMTIAAINIPKTFTAREKHSRIADEILDEIERIPSFPTNIIEIQKLCSTPDATIKEIAQSISMDPGLTSSILKLANSAGYITSNKIDSLEDAVKIIGTKGINTLLVATGVHNIMEKHYKKFEAIWNESLKKAFYAQKIAIQLKKTKISEFTYLAALLADIGKIVLLSIRPERLKAIKDLAGFKGIQETSDALEEITIGLSHSYLGSLICRKWNFDEALIKTIELHHRPHLAPENCRTLIYIVNLAENMLNIEMKKQKYELIDEDVLIFFNLNTREEFDSLHNILISTYNKNLIRKKVSS